MKKIIGLIILLSFMGLSVAPLMTNAQIPGEYLAADVGAADLLDIAEKHPILFWIGLLVVIILCIIFFVRMVVNRIVNKILDKINK
jgi:uncharacterized membrane protein YciS (DUF1049 family)